MNLRKNDKTLLYYLAILFMLIVIVVQGWQIRRYKENIAVLNKGIPKMLEKSIHYAEHNVNTSLNGVYEQLFPVNNALIYCFTDDMCDECIRQDLQELYQYQLIVGKEKLLVLPVCENDVLRSAAWEGPLRSFNYKNVPDTFSVSCDKNSRILKRYIAYIGDDGKVKTLFFPEKNEQTLTQMYLQSVIQRFCSK